MTQFEPMGPHDVIAARMKALRKGRGWSQDQLAAAMTEMGFPWDRSIVASFESRRRKSVSVEEFLGLAFVLDVAPVHLVVQPAPLSEKAVDAVWRLAPAGPITVPEFARAWIRGETPIGMTDAKRYFSQVPDEEWEPPVWSQELIERQSQAIRAAREASDAG